MSSQDVRIINLEPLHIASFLGFSAAPEMDAWAGLLSWATGKQLIDMLPAPRFFGFNNPSPSPGSPNYGYEAWMTIPAGVTPEHTVEIRNFAGGMYAVARCKGVESIPSTWGQLGRWLETSPYAMGGHQWLEEHLVFGLDMEPSAFVLDLYLPIKP